ncbi:MAG: alpha/beta fold hydrolase [Patescibacteria group bacterium]
MRRFFAILFFLFLIFIIAKNSYAFEPFVSSSSNPLNVTSHYSGWNEVGVLQGQIVKEGDSSYSMWYSSLGPGLRIAKASSSDGLSWFGNTFYAFLGNQDTSDPYFISGNPNYLYLATTPSGGTTRIMRITQANGIFDNSTIQEVLIPGKNWGVNGTTSPVVWYENNTHYLFYSALGATWDMGMATSQDGITFNECSGNPFLTGDTVPRSIIKYENEYYLFFHSPQGLGYVKTSALSCNTTWSSKTLLSISGYFPSALLIPGKLRLYYGSPAGGVWRLYLTTSSLSLPTPSPSPTPTPTIVPKNPIIIIPGLFGSWNKESILHGTTVDQTEWKLNPIVHEYDGLEKTLENVGYKKNIDYFLFAYDWRKNVESSADDLNTFINNLSLSSPPDIVGHSLGGLVGRLFAQKYGPSNVHNLITVGSPHGGTAKVYKTVEGGEIETDNSVFWLSQQLVLQLYRDGIKSNKQIIAEKFPVAQNLLPIHDYLKQGNVDISVSSMKIKNNVLPYNLTPINTLKAVVGEKGNTASGYIVTKRTKLDELLDYYPDGRPTQGTYSLGDFTVTSENAKMGINFTVLQKDHRELIYSKDGVKKILDNLNISYLESNVVEGRGTKVTPSLFFLMLSPAEMEVTHAGQSYQEQDGVIFIEDASSGVYQVRATGLAKGRYTILIGQVGWQSDVWSRIEGEITQDPPANQVDTYQVNFNDQSPSNPIITPQTLVDELIIYLADKNKTLKRTEITKSLTNLTIAKQYFNSQNRGKLKTTLLLIHQQLFIAHSKASSNDKYKILYAIEKLENLYDKTMGLYSFGIFPARLQLDLNNYKKSVDPTEKYLLSMKQRGKNIIFNVNYLLEIKGRLSLAEKSLGERDYNLAEIVLKSITELLREVRKF